MSVRVIQQVLRRSTSTGSARLLLLVLANYADDQGVCWPSIPTLAADCACSERYVSKLLRNLENAGELTSRRRGPHSARYRITLNDGSPYSVGEDLNHGSADLNDGAPQDLNHGSERPEPPFTQTVKNRQLNRREPSGGAHDGPRCIESDYAGSTTTIDAADPAAASQSGTIDRRTVGEPAGGNDVALDCGNARPRRRASGIDPAFWPDAAGQRVFGDSGGSDLGLAVEHFVDYWRSNAGKSHTARDWQARWRTWCRKSAEGYRTPGFTSPGRAGPGGVSRGMANLFAAGTSGADGRHSQFETSLAD